MMAWGARGCSFHRASQLSPARPCSDPLTSTGDPFLEVVDRFTGLGEGEGDGSGRLAEVGRPSGGDGMGERHGEIVDGGWDSFRSTPRRFQLSSQLVNDLLPRLLKFLF